MATASAAYSTWKNFGAEPVIALADRYTELWALYAGTAFSDALCRAHPALRRNQQIYKNTRLLWKHVEGVVDFYATTVYQGDLPTDGKTLPDGVQPAIPIDPQTGNDATNDDLLLAIAELWNQWNWKQGMTLRPMYAAALGDVLTELVDDVKRRSLLPATIWPGYVDDDALELDLVGNVKAYALQYPVKTDVETYTFRKEIDKESFRYFKNGAPFDAYGEGAVVPNPYGFVPAIWDRHKVVWGDHGASAIDGTRQALAELNSILSHGLDYQRKAFAAPIVVKGRLLPRNTDSIQLRKPPMTGTFDDGAALAQSLDILETQDGGIEQISFDVGKTLDMLGFIREGILSENPEAAFYHELRGMSQLTGPGVERALGDAVSRCRRARAGEDAQSIKLFQMATAIAGYRVNNGDWGPTSQLVKRQQAFARFDLGSYARGDLDFGILDRPVVLPTPQERLALIATKEALQTRWGLEQAGLDAEQAAAILADRAAAQGLSAAAFGRGLGDPEGEAS